MDYASILRVLVQLDGLTKATAGLTALDAAQKKVAGTSGQMGRDLDGSAGKARQLEAEVAKATTVTKDLGSTVERAGRQASGAGDGLAHASAATSGLQQGMRDAHTASQQVAQAFGALSGDTDDYTSALLRHNGISTQAVESAQHLAQARQSLAGQAGALLGDEDDLAGALQRSHQAHQDAIRATTELDTATRQLPQAIRTVNSGYAEASLSVAKAREELDRTGSVSRSTLSDLAALGSRGVSGLDRDLVRAGDTLRKAERELAATGDISRRTARDLAALGSAGGGAGGGIGALLGALSAGGGGLSVFGISILVLIPTVLALVGAVGALAAALGPLAGLAAGAGVAVSAAGQGFGVFKLASMGVADALKEQTTQQASAGSAAVTSAQQQRSAARAIQSALDGVRTAHEGVRTATQGLASAQQQARLAQTQLNQARADARRSLVDMAASLRQADFAEQSAAYALQDAKTALAQMVNGPDSGRVAEATRQVTNAIHSQQAAVLALTDAQRAYEDLVRPADAHTLAEAQQAVTNAQTGQEQAAVQLTKAQNAYNQVLGDATATELDKAEALANLHSAQNAVADAANRTVDAQAALDKLNAGPTDLEKAKALQAVTDAQDRVADATAAQADAQTALDKLNAPASSEEIGKAILAVVKAQADLANSTRDRVRLEKDLARAQNAGVEGSAQVLAAARAVRQANQQTANARIQLRDATIAVDRAEQAVADAQANAADQATKAAGAAGKLNQAMDALPAPAQAFVRQLVALKPKLDELRSTAAAGLFPGVAAGLAAVTGNFNPVKTVVGQTAGALGDLTRKAGELAGSPAWGKDIETVGGRNAKIIGTVGDAGLHVADAIRHLLVAAGPLTSWLAKTIDGWSREAEESAKAGRESGKLNDFFEKTRSVLQRVFSITGHLASGLLGVGKAGAKSGGDMLAAIDRAAKRFDQWTHSVDGQKSMKEFFEQSKDLLKNLTPVLEGVGKATSNIGFGPMNTALKLAGPYAEQLTYAFIAYKAAAGAAAVATTGYTIATNAGAAATKAWAAAQWVLNAALTANPIGLIIVGVAALVAAFVLAYKKIGWFHDAVDSVWNWIKDHWPLLVGILFGPFGIAASQIITHWGQITDFFKNLPGKIADLLKDGADVLLGAGHWLLTTILDGLKAGAELVAGAADWTRDQLVGAIKALASAFGTLGTWTLDTVVGGFKTVTSALGSAGGWLRDQIVGLVHGTVDQITGLGTWVLDKIVSGFKTVTSALGSVGGWLKNRAVELIHNEVDGLTAVGTWMLDKVVGGFKTVSEALSGVGSWVLGRVKDAFEAVKDNFANRGKDVIGWVVDGFTFVSDKGVSAVSGVGKWLLDQLGKVFGAVKDSFVDVGKDVVGWVIDGLETGLKKIANFAKSILSIVGEIPGVGGIADKGKDAIDDLIKGLATGGVYGQGFAHGGAFARTGGLVKQPITLMGEEAPMHPEWVIPENPAYRSRAIALHQAAGQALGLAQGGVWGKDDLKGLWRQANPGQGDPNLMAAISLAESSGNQRAVGHDPGGTLGLGLWQITTGFNDDLIAKYGGRSAMLDNPRANADAAGDLLARQGLGAWVVYNTGAYKQYLDGGGGGGVLGAIGGAIGSATDAVGDLLSKGVGSLLSALPSTDILPDWLKGTGHYVLDHATDWIKDKVASVLATHDGGGTASLPLPSGIAGSIKDAIALAMRMGFAEPSINQLTGGHHADGSYHYQGRAADFGAAGHTVEQMKALFAALLGKFGAHIREMFYDPEGYYIKNGARISGAIGGHSDHLHIALAKGGVFGGLPFGGSFADGGIVPGPLGAPTAIIAHGGERVTPATNVPATSGAPVVNFHGPVTFRDERDAITLAREVGWEVSR